MCSPNPPTHAPVDAKVFVVSKIAICLEGVDVPFPGNGCEDEKLVNATELTVWLLRLVNYREEDFFWKRGDRRHFLIVDLNDMV